MKPRAAAPGLAVSMILGLTAAQAPAQVISRPPDLRLEDVVDSLAGPGGRVVMGDVEYRIGQDPGAKGGLGVMVQLWPGGTVPYVLDSSFTKEQRGRLVQAMRRWQDVAPVRFVERTNQPDYVRVVRHETANSSCVGRCGGEQTVRLTERAATGVMLHELGHTLGMSHEHVRSDRDRYVRVLTSNIETDFIHNFRVVRTENCTPYDFGSIMHYGQSFFSTNGSPTLLPHAEYAGFTDLMGGRVELTESDIRDVRVAYGAETCAAPGPGPTPGPTPSPRTVDIELTGNLGHQRVVFSPDFNVDALREGWSQGLDLVTGAEGPDGQVLVMARGQERAVQHLSYNTPEWPRDHVAQYWDDPDHVITGVFGGPSGWSVIMSRVESVYVPSAQRSLENWGWTSQSWRLRAEWPRDDIRELWDEGKDITDIAHGPGGWLLVFSSETYWGAQGWDSTDDPEGKIRDRWNDGYSITDIAYDGSLWFLVATKNAGIGAQRWVSSDTFPEDEIRQAWAEGMHVQAMDYGGGLWYVVFSQR